MVNFYTKKLPFFHIQILYIRFDREMLICYDSNIKNEYMVRICVVLLEKTRSKIIFAQFQTTGGVSVQQVLNRYAAGEAGAS